MKRGAFILFEGIDCSGKTTQCEKLTQALDLTLNKKVQMITFPDRETEIGKVINGYLTQRKTIDDHAIHLLFSANRWEKNTQIRQMLINEETTVICDRYAFSGVAFTLAKPSFETVASKNFCETCDIGLPAPDLVIFLDIDPVEASKRKGFGSERYEKLEFQKRVRNLFLKNAKQDTWYVLDATRSIDDLHNEILCISHKIIDKVCNEPVKDLIF